jgi:23S rRNA (adenine2030-N6)-methyltransferase
VPCADAQRRSDPRAAHNDVSLNYHHAYHAGNFADVAKHVALVACLEALKRKPAPWFALDTHAGAGIYDLDGPEARKSGEAGQGILRLLGRAALDPERSAPLTGYLRALGADAGQPLHHYRGSAALIAGALRPGDRAALVELDPAAARATARQLKSLGRLNIESGDGYAALRARLPPAERRGLVLIDPPYERPDEVDVLLEALAQGWRRWQTGIFLVWYPIRSAQQRASVHRRFRALAIPKMLHADLAIHADDAGIGLAGSGLLIINPPYGLDEHLRTTYRAIHDVLANPDAGYVEVARLTAERDLRHER